MRNMIRKASSSTGSADMMSTMRMITKSTPPPFQPAARARGQADAQRQQLREDGNAQRDAHRTRCGSTRRGH